MISIRLKIIIMIFFCTLLGCWAEKTQAGSLSVIPTIIDEQVIARDILKESLVLKNNSNSKITAYVFVNNILAQGGEQSFLDPSKADQSSSLANWIEISRGVVELMPWAQKNIDFTIAINLRAKPGRYHAVIYFAEGSTRAEAEKYIFGSASILINLDVSDNSKEKLQLKKFIPDKRFFSDETASFSYILENIGTKAVAYAGDIRIYNNRGEEVSSVPVQSGSEEISPGNDQKIMAAGSLAENFGMGRYKALLTLEYGASGQGTVQDTVFFWVIPWARIAVIFFCLSVVVIGLTSFCHRRYVKKLQKYN